MTTKIVTISGESYEADSAAIEIVALRESEAEIRVGDRTYFVPFAIKGSEISFAFDGEIWSADVVDKGARTRKRSGDHSMSAPMPGSVLKILVAPGDVVQKGAPLLILEAMKMEHQLTAPRDGTVAAINCKEGELVQPGVDLVTLT